MKQNPTPKKPVLFSLPIDTDMMLDAMTDNRSWLVDKLIRDEWYRTAEAQAKGRPVRKLPIRKESADA